ncbi:unnamed protein product [Durusdinium trenchii]|uniref:C962R-like N-terminal AEP domain-containing protein n=1 Tax=Durusdinium trenchii TaxID=1381693 RepID=A0ABP0QBK7_9DINO
MFLSILRAHGSIGSARCPAQCGAALGDALMAYTRKVRLLAPWTDPEVLWEGKAAELLVSSVGAVLQGSVSSEAAVRPGTWPLGRLEGEVPPEALRSLVLAAPERPERGDLPKYDRAALLDIVGEKLTLIQGDGAIVRIQLSGVAWLFAPQQQLLLEDQTISLRCAEGMVFWGGCFRTAFSQEEIRIGRLPSELRPCGGRRSYLSVCFHNGHIHVLRFTVEGETGHVQVQGSHVQGRARDGHAFAVSVKAATLETPMSSVRYLLTPGKPLELLAAARPPKQQAARKQLAYLGLQDDEAIDGDELEGFQIASCRRAGHLVLLDGAVLLKAAHRYTAWARLPVGCRPEVRVTLVVARGFPKQQLAMERLDIFPNGECLCPQLPEDLGATHALHLGGAVFGVETRADVADAADVSTDAPTEARAETEEARPVEDGLSSLREDDSPALAWKRLQDLEARDRRFRGKFQSVAEFKEFERTLQWFRAHDCTESHRLTHSCFKGRSDFTQTGMLVFDTEEDLEGLNKAIAWLFHRHIPVVLMERQTRVFPLIFDMDLKVTSKKLLDAVPRRLKLARPWRHQVDFCLWHGADHFVLSEDLVLLRHLGMIVFQFFPDLPLIDFCIFNASGWDRVKELVKVSLHLVAPYVLVTPERLGSIRERMLEYLGECSEVEDHPLAKVLQTYLEESEDNTWDKVVDQTVTSGTNGLRMPYCDKAQRILKREFVERKEKGEFFTERELMDQHAYLKEEAGRPCLPEGILRLIPCKDPESDLALPEARWMCKGNDLPIDEWIRLGRCRHSWRLPLAPGPTLWRPPLRYQWAEPAAPWEDRAQLKGSPVVRRYSGSCAEFRHQWQEALPETRLLGRWLCGRDARWIGGLQETSTHEVRYILKAQRVVLLLSPEPSAALTFTEFRKALEGWTEPDDVMCVPICGAPFDRHASALHTIVAPSEEFPSIQAALDAVPFDEPLHRVLLRQGSYEVSTLEIQRPVLLEGEGHWETTLSCTGGPVLRLSGLASHAMVRNLRLKAGSNGTCHGAAAVEIRTEGEPTIVGCRLYAEGPWGSCISAYGGSPQILRNFVSCARWGLVLVQTAGRVEDNSIRGLGEAGVVLVGGSTFIHRNSFSDCGGPAILAVSDCCAVLQKNDVRDCLSGVKVMGKRSEIQMRTGNRLLHNGIMDEHQLEAPPGVIPIGATATIKSCRPFSFLPKSTEELSQRLKISQEYSELLILIRAARRKALWAQAAKAFGRLQQLPEPDLRPGGRARPGAAKVAPAAREVLVAGKAWDGPGAGYGEQCVAVLPGTMCEVLRRGPQGWLLVWTSGNQRGWCSPHVFG